MHLGAHTHTHEFRKQQECSGDQVGSVHEKEKGKCTLNHTHTRVSSKYAVVSKLTRCMGTREVGSERTTLMAKSVLPTQMPIQNENKSQVN